MSWNINCELWLAMAGYERLWLAVAACACNARACDERQRRKVDRHWNGALLRIVMLFCSEHWRGHAKMHEHALLSVDERMLLMAHEGA